MMDYRLDKEELELLDSIENNEWVSVDNLQHQIKEHQEVARNTLKKDKRINIRLSSFDLEALKTSAAEMGLPYQTLVSSILHQYISGRLVSIDDNKA
jgi:predicted DNA binding CopG/RHH family protein